MKKLVSLIASFVLAICMPSTITAETINKKVVIMTSYPEEVVSRFEAAFEKAYPDVRIEIIWRHSGDAMRYLHDNPGSVDVYWTPAQRAFAKLAREGAFKNLPFDMTGLPNSVGSFQISDPNLQYVATEIAGFGFAVNPERLQSKDLSPPKKWEELSDLKWQDELSFPTPSQVGFAPPLVEVLVQGYGWEKGWTLLQRIGSNAIQNPIEGNSLINVSKGDISLAVSMDFFVKTAIDSGAPISFHYPNITSYSAAHVAIFNDAPNPDEANLFTQFVLSEAGQMILFHPDILKLPVRPAVYEHKPSGYYDPFQSEKLTPLQFNNQRALERQGLNNALFDILVSDQHELLRQSLNVLRKAQQIVVDGSEQSAQLKQAYKLVTQTPISETQANTLAHRFVANFEINDEAHSNTELLRNWSKQVKQNRLQAIKIAQQIIDNHSSLGSASQ